MQQGWSIRQKLRMKPPNDYAEYFPHNYELDLTGVQMAQIDRDVLERPLSLRGAAEIVRRFLEDTDAYPDEEFRMRRGMCKVLAEEYLPLFRFARSLRCVRSIHLYPESHNGPDGEVRFWLRPAWHVQITCSSEGHDRALMREQMQQGDIVSSGTRWRDPVTKHVVQQPSAFNAADDVRTRVERILGAVEAKESNYHAGTDTLLVQDDHDRWDYLKRAGLRDQVAEAVGRKADSHYRRTYVLYGEEAVRVR
jgi:hypothetical protein